MAPSQNRKRKPDPGEAAEEPQVLSASADAKRQKKLPVRAKEGDERRPQSSNRPGAVVKGALKVFDDDDDDEAEDSAPLSGAVSNPPELADQEEAPSEDSDDDAPEAISTHQAAADVKKSTHAAQKAFQEQATAQKRKRQHRDALFKQQAKERKKIEEEAAAQLNASPEEGEERGLLSGVRVRSSGARKRLDKIPVPALLPTEYLTDSSSDDEDDDGNGDAEVRTRRKARKISTVERTLTRLDIGPRDKRVGSTVYRVARKTDERMAPKLNKNSQGRRQMLLKRNRPAVKARTGFLSRR